MNVPFDFKRLMRPVSQQRLTLMTALFLALFGNGAFFANVLKVYPLNFANAFFIASLFLVLVAVTYLLLTLVSGRYTTKPVLMTVLAVSSATGYFMGTYNVVIDDGMIQNIVQTNVGESADLLSVSLFMRLLFFGALPALYVYRVPIRYRSWRKELKAKLLGVGISLALIGFLLFAFSQFYASFFREHKPLRYYTNPTYWIYSIGHYLAKNTASGPVTVRAIGTDAKVAPEPADEADLKELVVLVVGEAARADRFSLNGYPRATNPMLEKEGGLVNFTNMSSCGTSTAVSVPCMFSLFGKEEYDEEKGRFTENILDVLVHTGSVEVLWRDNNSDSKGVALRVPFEDFRTPAKNPVCDEECRDEGMLAGLDDYIARHRDKDMLIVLHMMGNHGPAYYKRYPKSFEVFTPVCETNQLEECTPESIGNAYDNAIRYTDYFLAKVIAFLKPYSKSYETAMFYISDHGESLGESGLYLHGLPYFMAPETQTHVASMVWFDGAIAEDVDRDALRGYRTRAFTQDNLFHSLLGLFEVETDLYDPEQDMLHDATIPE